MTRGSVVIRRLAVGFVGVGALAIIVGNSQITLGVTAVTQSIGYAVRYMGIVICTITAVLFLAVRVGARLPRRTQLQNPTSVSSKLVSTGPSDALLASIRVYCIFLFFLGIFSLVSSLSALMNMALGQFRIAGMQPVYYLVYMLFQPAVLLMSGFLIWFMTDAIRRMSEQLDQVTYEIAKLQQRMHHVQQGTEPVDSGLGIRADCPHEESE